jgi:predicted lipoprotein with Yx(FWY)xxD motif
MPRAVLPAAVLAGTLALAAIALGARAGFVVTSAHNSTLGEQVVVDNHGDTLYVLHPETAHHLLCTSEECLKFWPPLTVSSRTARLKAGPGVKGKLGVIRRKRGVFQLTLRGEPLYRFSGDHVPGQANGQGIKSFGGQWFAATAAHSSHKHQAGANGGSGPQGANGGPNPGGNEGSPPSPPGGPGTSSTSTASSSSTATTVTTTTTMTTYTYTYTY